MNVSFLVCLITAVTSVHVYANQFMNCTASALLRRVRHEAKYLLCSQICASLCRFNTETVTKLLCNRKEVWINRQASVKIMNVDKDRAPMSQVTDSDKDISTLTKQIDLFEDRRTQPKIKKVNKDGGSSPRIKNAGKEREISPESQEDKPKVCMQYSNRVTLKKLWSIEGHNHKVYNLISLKECIKNCIRLRVFLCKSFDYRQTFPKKCQLSKYGYYEVDKTRRQIDQKGWIFGSRECEKYN